MATKTPFSELLETLVVQFGSRAALGKAIGMSGSRVGRAMGGQYNSFNVLNCLKLARVSGRSASEILRAAGKTDIAVAIEQLYGRSRPTTDPATREWLEVWDRLPVRTRERFLAALRDLLTAAPAQPSKQKSA